MITADELTYTTTDTGYTILLNGKAWIVQDGYFPYDGETMADKAQAHINALIAAQKAAEETAAKPTEEEKQQAAMLLTQAQQAETIATLQKSNAALMLKLAGGNT